MIDAHLAPPAVCSDGLRPSHALLVASERGRFPQRMQQPLFDLDHALDPLAGEPASHTALDSDDGTPALLHLLFREPSTYATLDREDRCAFARVGGFPCLLATVLALDAANG